MREIKAIMKKEFIEILRDKKSWILTNYFNPVTHFLICIRSILLKGAGIKEIYPL